MSKGAQPPATETGLLSITCLVLIALPCCRGLGLLTADRCTFNTQLNRGGLNLGALMLALMVAMATVWWGQAQGDLLGPGGRAKRSTDIE